MNEAREFLEIAKDFKDPREIIREALSNSWDARATKATLKFTLVPISGTRKRKIVVEIADDGEGMSSVQRSNGFSEIESFFNLGDSYKPYGSIGSKGHGTKIYYKSLGIKVDTWKDGSHVHAETEVAPWESLTRGIVPTYQFEEEPDAVGRGTRIVVDGFQAKQAEFATIDELARYIQWFTVIGSFGGYFGSPRKMDVELKPTESALVTLPFGFRFPDEDTDPTHGTNSACKILGPRTINCGTTEDGVPVNVEVVGALLGDAHRGLVPHTYTHMGLWLCKDYIRVERKNELLEDVFGGQYYYRSMLLFANCQQFDLTANRNNVRTDQEEYELALKGISEFCQDVWNDAFVKSYFEAKRTEDKQKQREENERRDDARKSKNEQRRNERLNRYKARPDLNAKSILGALVKEPQSESETALLLQAMITAKHPAVDFVIGDYNTTNGVDLIIEQVDKGVPTIKWAELVLKLERLYQWSHPPEGYHCVICYELGAVKEVQQFTGGEDARLVKKPVRGRYTLLVGADSIDVYVLKELLEHQ